MLRNRVNRVRKSLQCQYFLDKIDSLKTDNPAKWYKTLKSICRLNGKTNTNFNGITYRSEAVNDADLPCAINSFLAELTSGIPALNPADLHAYRVQLNVMPDKFCVPVVAVLKNEENKST